jgi:hypothetical protein
VPLFRPPVTAVPLAAPAPVRPPYLGERAWQQLGHGVKLSDRLFSRFKRLDRCTVWRLTSGVFLDSRDPDQDDPDPSMVDRTFLSHLLNKVTHEEADALYAAGYRDLFEDDGITPYVPGAGDGAVPCSAAPSPAGGACA